MNFFWASHLCALSLISCAGQNVRNQTVGSKTEASIFRSVLILKPDVFTHCPEQELNVKFSLPERPRDFDKDFYLIFTVMTYTGRPVDITVNCNRNFSSCQGKSFIFQEKRFTIKKVFTAERSLALHISALTEPPSQ